MTRKSLMTTAAAAAVAVLSWIPALHAQDAGAPPRHEHGPGFGRGGPGGPGGPGLGRMAEQLGLSDEQKTQLEALHAKQRETLQPLMESARQARDAFESALEADSPDAAAVGQAAITMKAAEKKVRAAHDAAFEEMKSILTPEQQKKLEEARQHGPRGAGGLRP